MIGLLFYSLFNVLEINTVWMFIIGVLVFSSIYIPLFCFFGMTSYEKELFFSPMQRNCKSVSENFMINIEDKKECCGCSACVQRCPKQCIVMKEDEEGFFVSRR